VILADAPGKPIRDSDTLKTPISNSLTFDACTPLKANRLTIDIKKALCYFALMYGKVNLDCD
jgi:hypothetical protein